MKAVIFTEYGSPDLLQLKEVDKPVPSDNEVLVEIHAASLNAGDWHTLRGTPFLVRLMNGLRKPKEGARILGDDMAGRIEAVGRNVKQFQPGDEVFGFSNSRRDYIPRYVSRIVSSAINSSDEPCAII